MLNLQREASEASEGLFMGRDHSTLEKEEGREEAIKEIN